MYDPSEALTAILYSVPHLLTENQLSVGDITCMSWPYIISRTAAGG